MKKFLLMSVFACFAYASYAQVSLGFTAGVNAANIGQDYAESNSEEDTKFKLAPRLGVVVDYALSDALSFRSGLIYSGKGYAHDLKEGLSSGEEVKGYSRASINYLEVPLTGVYKSGSLEIVVGPYVAFGISGKHKMDMEYTSNGSSFSLDGEQDIKFTNEVSEAQQDDENVYVKGFDAGLSLGLGYNVGPGVVSVSYTKGLANLTPKYEGSTFDPADAKVTNSVLGVSFTYFLNK